jgi:hypothetical protein
MKRVLFVVLVALCALARPTSVFAQSDIIDWLESLSGPGPFHGYFMSVSSRAFCSVDEGRGQGQRIKWWCADDSDRRIKQVVEAEFAFTSSDSHTRFQDALSEAQNTQPVHATRVIGNYYYRFHPMLDLGVGAGVIVFSGDDFTNQVHPILSPLTLKFTPFGFLHGDKSLRWGRVFRVEFAERFILGDIRAADFHSFVSTYVKQGEWNRQLSLAVDFWPVLFKNR